MLKAGAILQKKHAIRYLLITLGEAGMLLLEQGQKPYHTPTRAQEVFDVSGAGDTAIAAFTLALAAGATGIEAAEIANHAAGRRRRQTRHRHAERGRIARDVRQKREARR